MLRAAWQDRFPVIWQARHPRPGFLCLDPDADASALSAQVVVCLAGVTPATAAATGCAMDLNVDLALQAVRMAAGMGADHVFLASSAAVYGAAGGVLAETGDCHPVSDYGRAKLRMEHEARALGRRMGVGVTALRIGNVAGADAILGGWRAGMQIDRLSDGRTPRRSYIGPACFARALGALICRTADLPGVINLSAPGAVEMGALLDAAGLAWQPREAGPGVIAEVELSTRRLARHVRFAPADSSPEGLAAQFRDFQAMA